MFDSIQTLVLQYKTELFALLMGIPFSWFISLAFDIFQPEALSDAAARKLIFLICVVGSAIVSAVLWEAVDPGDAAVVRVIVSIVAAMGSALLAPYVHRIALWALGKWVPGLESAFRKPEKQP